MKDNSASISIHIDEALFSGVDKNKKNYGWFCESSSIIPNYINNVLSNIEHYKTKFEYIFTHDRRIVDIDPSFFKFILPCAKPWIRNKKIYDKTKFISFIGSNKLLCEGHSYRHKIIQKYQNNVEHYGRGFANKELPWTIDFDGVEESGKILALKDYMFSIAMENADYDDIFCEKITDCFATGVLPIFWGTKNIKNYFDPDGIIMLDEDFDINLLTKDLYYSKIKSIENNFNLCQELLTSEDYMFLNFIK